MLKQLELVLDKARLLALVLRLRVLVLDKALHNLEEDMVDLQQLELALDKALHNLEEDMVDLQQLELALDRAQPNLEEETADLLLLE
jgi:chromosome segregation ATPase